MPPSADHFLLALIEWHPRFSGIWCGVILLAEAAWLYYLHRRMRRRVSPGRARWLLLPKILTLVALLFVLFNPVSAMQKDESVKGKLLVLVDSSSSMDVADDYHRPRVVRARQIVEGALFPGAPDQIVDKTLANRRFHRFTSPGKYTRSAGGYVLRTACVWARTSSSRR